MLDVFAAHDRHKFLGHEFLTWSCFLTEGDPDRLRTFDPDITFLGVGSRVVLENELNDVGEGLPIKGDDAGLEKGNLALRRGVADTGPDFVSDADALSKCFPTRFAR